MGSTAAVRTDLRDHFLELNRLVPVRVVTVVPGVEYYGKVLTVGSDHVVLSTDYHTVTVALSHIVSAFRDPFGSLNPEHQNFVSATARTLSTDRPVCKDARNGEQDGAPPATRPPRGWRPWFLGRR